MAAEANLEESGVYVRLFNGRSEPGEQLEDWGADGPVLGPFSFAHMVWASEINLGDEGESLKIVDSTVFYGGIYYADFSIVSAAHFNATDELRASHAPFDRAKAFPSS